MSQAASRERICSKAVVLADMLVKAVVWGRRAPGIIKEEYESFTSGHFRTFHMARTGMRWIMCKKTGVREGRHALLT